jgi:hypothetical protein
MSEHRGARRNFEAMEEDKLKLPGENPMDKYTKIMAGLDKEA